MVSFVQNTVAMTDTDSEQPTGSGGSPVQDLEVLEQFFASAPSLMAMLDGDGIILAHSDRWEDLSLSDLTSFPGAQDDGTAVSFFDLVADADGTWAGIHFAQSRSIR